MNKDIHFYATFSAARLAGMSEHHALLLAYFCHSSSEYHQNAAYQISWHTSQGEISPPANLSKAKRGFPFSGVASNYWDLRHGYSSLFQRETPNQQRARKNSQASPQYHGAGANFRPQNIEPCEPTAIHSQESRQHRAVKHFIRQANPLTSYFWAGQFDRKHSLRGFFGVPAQPKLQPEIASDFIEVDDAGNATYISQGQSTNSTAASPPMPEKPTIHTHSADMEPSTAQAPLLTAENVADSRAHRDLLQQGIYQLGQGQSLAHLGVSLYCYQNGWLCDSQGLPVPESQRSSLDLFSLFHGTKTVIGKYLQQQAIPLEGSFQHYFDEVNAIAECLFTLGDENQRCARWLAFINEHIEPLPADPFQLFALQYNPLFLLHQLQQSNAVEQDKVLDENAFWQSHFGQHAQALHDIAQWHDQLVQ